MLSVRRRALLALTLALIGQQASAQVTETKKPATVRKTTPAKTPPPNKPPTVSQPKTAKAPAVSAPTSTTKKPATTIAPKLEADTCDRVGTTTIVFGRTGGEDGATDALVIRDDGIIQILGDATAISDGRVINVPPAAVRGLSRLAWTNGFATLRSYPSRPARVGTSRDFIELRSACGSKHVEYAIGDAAPPFLELQALLQTFAKALANVR